VRKPEEKSQLGRHRPTSDNIKIDLRKIGWGGMDWLIWFRIGTSGRALVNTVVNLSVPYNVGKFYRS
jgi:hypothetical protein